MWPPCYLDNGLYFKLCRHFKGIVDLKGLRSYFLTVLDCSRRCCIVPEVLQLVKRRMKFRGETFVMVAVISLSTVWTHRGHFLQSESQETVTAYLAKFISLLDYLVIYSFERDCDPQPRSKCHNSRMLSWPVSNQARLYSIYRAQ